MNEAAIRERVRKLVASGELSCDEPDRTWAGEGVGKRCAGCLMPIVRPEIECEVQLPPPDFRTFVLHQRCHDVWREVCDELKPPS